MQTWTNQQIQPTSIWFRRWAFQKNVGSSNLFRCPNEFIMKFGWGWENVEIPAGLQILHYSLFPVTDTKSYSSLLESNFGAGRQRRWWCVNVVNLSRVESSSNWILETVTGYRLLQCLKILTLQNVSFIWQKENLHSNVQTGFLTLELDFILNVTMLGYSLT